MGMHEITALLRDNIASAALAIVAVVFACMLVLTINGVRLRNPFRRKVSSTELRFRNVFGMMGEERRQALIDSYCKKYKCNREQAMRHALEERDRDARSWR
ncbi:hypothetical protein ASD64_14700 [Mesorhizobium sp. Root157]|nr:hypothetical protein ASD64_14700 [Mesorhizobium sp. Root157]